MRQYLLLGMLLASAPLGACDGPETTPPLNADAGPDIAAAAESTITLSATAEGGAKPYTYRWSIEAQPAEAEYTVADANTNAVLEVGAIAVQGDYVFRVRVTDSSGQTDSSFVTVAVGGDLPLTITAELLSLVNEPTPLELAIDTDTTGFENRTIEWEVLRGEAELSDAASANPEVTILADTTVQLRVTVAAESDNVTLVGVEEVFIVGINTLRPRVVIENEGAVSGDIVIELLTEDAPNACANLLRYVDDQFFDGVVWHRTLPDFVIQGGAYQRQDDTLVEREGGRPPIEGQPDNGRNNVRGTLAMALLGSDRDSGDKEFFINLVDNAHLDGDFTVFAEVVEGMDVADEISVVETSDDPSGLQNVPDEDIVMRRVRRGIDSTTNGAELTVTATATDAWRVINEATQLGTLVEGLDDPANADYQWEVLSGSADFSDATAPDSTATILSEDTAHLRVTVTGHEDGTQTGSADVYVVGVSDPTPQVVIESEGGVDGEIVLELFAEDAPNTCASFLRYVDDGFYQGILWHRIEADAYIQTGGYVRDQFPVEAEGVRPPIQSEALNGHSNLRGSVAMVLLDDADSATSQFFINIVNNPEFDEGPPPFTVFAQVVGGMDVADEIAAVETGLGYGGLENIPKDDITMTIRRDD